jgi:ABC-type transport system involved in cytochrome bd biosynthesis fused ATPase/permease subunit
VRDAAGRPVPPSSSRSCRPDTRRWGDGGRPLSAGETQRIALARVLLRDAPLLILDEPTANLDPVSAELVRAAVDRCRQGRTVLVIAPDDELASRADRIVQLQATGS